MTYSFAVGVLVHMHVRCCVYTHEWMYVRKHRAYVHLNMHKEYTFHFAGRQLRILNCRAYVYLHMHKEYTPVVRCVYSNLWTHFCVHIRIEPRQNNAFFGCVYSFPP